MFYSLTRQKITTRETKMAINCQEKTIYDCLSCSGSKMEMEYVIIELNGSKLKSILGSRNNHSNLKFIKSVKYLTSIFTTNNMNEVDKLIPVEFSGRE